jgi:hypothetical protein
LQSTLLLLLLLLHTQMANLEQANTTMYNFAAAAKRKAQAEVDLITQFAADNGFEGPLQPWDVKYWRERYKREVFRVDEATLRDYLLVDNVLEGMFQVRYIDCYMLCYIMLGCDCRGVCQSAWRFSSLQNYEFSIAGRGWVL